MAKQVDYSFWTEPTVSDEQLRGAGESILESWKTHGYAMLDNTGLPTSKAVQSAMAVCQRYFSLPEDVKQKAAVRPQEGKFHGYTGPGKERVAGMNLKEGKYDDIPEDIKELITLNKVDGVEYPAEAGDLRPAMHAYWDNSARLAMVLMQSLGLALYNKRNYFEHLFTSMAAGTNVSNVRVCGYPPADGFDVKPKQMRCGPHVDFGVITCLIQEEQGGLQVCTPSGEWVEPPGRKTTVLLLPDDILQTWTGGRVKATPHQVAFPRDGRESRWRHSAIFFLLPDQDAHMEPLDHDGRPVAGAGGLTVEQHIKQDFTSIY